MHIELNLQLFLADLAGLTQRIVRLKGLLGARWTRPMKSEQRELSLLKRRATELCALRAFSRGKLHVQTPRAGDGQSAEHYHARIAERLGPQYRRLLESA